MDDPALEDRLNKILKRLAVVADRPERELRYKIILVDVPMINALTLPGGSILVFRGLVDMVKNKMGDTDDAYASVLGHECAHAALRPKVRGFDLAVKALNGGDYEAAQAKLEVFLGVFPDSLSARSNLGVALHRKALSALEPATRFRRSTDVDPNSRARKIELRAGE